jgi:Porin subfamily
MSVFSTRAGILRLAFVTCVMGFAVLFAGTAQAAKPAEYVKICSLYGAGFYYIPGTDTCIKVGGYLRVENPVQTGSGWICDSSYYSSAAAA